MEPELSRAALYAAATPIIIALTEILKRVGVPSRYAPLVAVVLGLLFALGVVTAVPLPVQPIFVTILVGLTMGLSAAGMYSGGRALAER